MDLFPYFHWDISSNLYPWIFVSNEINGRKNRWWWCFGMFCRKVYILIYLLFFLIKNLACVINKRVWFLLAYLCCQNWIAGKSSLVISFKAAIWVFIWTLDLKIIIRNNNAHWCGLVLEPTEKQMASGPYAINSIYLYILLFKNFIFLFSLLN